MMIHVERITLIVTLDLKAQYLVQDYINRSTSKKNPNNANKKVVLKNCVPFTDSMNETNKTQIDNAKHIGVITPLYNLIEYSDNYSKTREGLWQYDKDETDWTDDYYNDYYYAADNSALFKFKQKITDVTKDDGTINIEIMVPSNYLSSLWRTLEMLLNFCEINFI